MKQVLSILGIIYAVFAAASFTFSVWAINGYQKCNDALVMAAQANGTTPNAIDFNKVRENSCGTVIQVSKLSRFFP